MRIFSDVYYPNSKYNRTVCSRACCLICWTGLNWFMDILVRATCTIYTIFGWPARKESNVPKLKSSLISLKHTPKIKTNTTNTCSQIKTNISVIYYTHPMSHIDSICIRIWWGHQPKYVILFESEHLLVYIFPILYFHITKVKNIQANCTDTLRCSMYCWKINIPDT